MIIQNGFFSDGKWYGGWGDSKFPGINAMIGVKQLSTKEIIEIIKCSSDLKDNPITVTINNSKKNEKACFVATAVYGGYDKYEVYVLRNYRDEVLAKNNFGKLFIKIYYKFGPYLACFIENNSYYRKWVKILLNKFVKRLKNDM